MKAYAKGALFHVGGALLILGGGSLSPVGVFTKASGDPHSLVSLGYFMLFPAAMGLVGLAFRKAGAKARGALSALSGGAALAVILSAIAFRWHRLLGLGFAVPEIVEAFVIAAWVFWMGSSLVYSARRGVGA